MSSLSKQEYEAAFSKAFGQPIVLSDQDYRALLKGQKLSEAAITAAKTRAMNAGDDFATPDVAPMYTPPVKGPSAPATSSIGKIAPATMGPPVVASGPALSVDSGAPGAAPAPSGEEKAARPPPVWATADSPISTKAAWTDAPKYDGFEDDGQGDGKAYAINGTTKHQPLPAEDGKDPLYGTMKDPYLAMRVAAAFGGTPANRARWDEAQGRWVPELEDRGLRQDAPSAMGRRKG